MSKGLKKSNEYLKHLTIEDYNNEIIQEHIVKNFLGFGDSLMSVTPEQFNVLLNGSFSESLKNRLLYLTPEQCEYLRVPLKMYLEDPKSHPYHTQTEWLAAKFEESPHLFALLEKNHPFKNEENKDMIMEVVTNHNYLFKYLPDEWQEDFEFIMSLPINMNKTTGIRFSSTIDEPQINVQSDCILSPQESSVSFEHILNEVKDVGRLLDHIQKRDNKEKSNEAFFINTMICFPRLNKELRANKRIIENLFRLKCDYEISEEYIQSIEDKDLSKTLIDILKEKRAAKMNLSDKPLHVEMTELKRLKISISELSDLFKKTIDLYYMEKHLDSIEKSEIPDKSLFKKL